MDSLLGRLIMETTPYRRPGRPFSDGGGNDWIGHHPRYAQAERNGATARTPIISGGPMTPQIELTDEDIALLLLPLPERI